MQESHIPGIGSIDLRALRFLMEVLDRRNVTRAGATMGLSQPAASRLLAQLRRALGGDPLLVRGSGGTYVLTPRATDLMPRVAEAIAATDRVFAPITFDPATSTRAFRVATTDYGAAVVLPTLARTFWAAAPALSLELAAWNTGTLAALEDGSFDFALYADEALPPTFRRAPLFADGFVCVVRRDHPVLRHRDANGYIAPARLAALPRTVLLYPDGAAMGVDDPLAAYGRPIGPGDVRLPYFLAAPLIVSGSPSVLCIPRRMADLVVGAADLAMIDFPEAGRLNYCMIRHDRTARDAGLDWIQARLTEAFAASS